MKAAVSIVGFHTPLHYWTSALSALSRQDLAVDRVRIHLNEATDQDGSRIARLAGATLGAERVGVSWSEANTGFCAAHNRLLEEHFAAGAGMVVVHNPDLALDTRALGVLARAVEQGPNALYGPVLELADAATLGGEGLIDSAGIRWTRGGRHFDDRQGRPMSGLPSEDQVLVAGISGACLAVSRQVHQRINDVCGEFFDEEFIAYREDAELGHRAHLLGVASFVLPEARGLHVRALRAGVRRQDPHVDRLGVRNRFLLAAKYGRRRPGGLWGPLARDLAVIAGVLVQERSSLPALSEAWRLRRSMRAKGRLVLDEAKRLAALSA